MRPSIITRDFLAQRVGLKSVFVEDVTKKVEELEKLVFPVTNGYQQLYDNFDFIVDAMDVFENQIDNFITVTEEVYSEYDDDDYFYDLIELNRLCQRLVTVLSHIEVLSFHLSCDMNQYGALISRSEEQMAGEWTINVNWLEETIEPESKKNISHICKEADNNLLSFLFYTKQINLFDKLYDSHELILIKVQKLTPSDEELECAFQNQYQLYWNDIRDEVASVLGRQHKALMHVCENLQKHKSWEKFAMVEEDALGLAVCSKLTASDDKRHRIYDKETREKYEKYKEVVDRFLEVCMGHNDEMFDIKWRTVNEKGLIEVLDTYSYEFADELIARRNYVVKKIYETSEVVSKENKNSKKNIKNYIPDKIGTDKLDKEFVLEKLHNLLDGQRGVMVAKILRSSISVKYLTTWPTYGVFKAEFNKGTIIQSSKYYKYRKEEFDETELKDYKEFLLQ